MTSRSMMRSVSAPAADVAPPASVALALRSTPFRSATTRRDLATSYRGFKAAWTAIEQVHVLSASCRRLGERAAEVLTAVRDKLEEIEREEARQKAGKVVLERSYEFQGSKTGSEQGGKTVFKIQSAMLDIQAFATDHLATSQHSRLALLVDNLSNTKSSLAKLTHSLLVCISTYALSSSVATSHWSDEDSTDLARDDAALPRLFQLSIVLKGPIYNRFTKERTGGPTSNETPGQRRAAFIEWCLETNPILRSDRSRALGGGGGDGGGFTAIGVAEARRPPSSGLGLGLPSTLSLGAGGVSMRRAVTQPLSFQQAPPSIPTPVKPPTEPTRTTGEVLEKTSPPSTSESSRPPSSTQDPSPLPDQSVAPDSPLMTVPPIEATSDSRETLSTSDTISTLAHPGLVPLSLPGPVSSVPSPLPKLDRPDTPPTSHALDRSTSTVSSMAMTSSSSMTSVLFEPALPAIELVDDGEIDVGILSEPSETKAVTSIIDMEHELKDDASVRGLQTEMGEGVEKETQRAESEEGNVSRVTAATALRSPQQEEEEDRSAEAPLEAEVRPRQGEADDSILGLALDIPLPLSPQVENLSLSHRPLDEATNTPADSISPRLLAPLPIDVAKDEPSASSESRLLEPLHAPSSPTLPSSPSLIVTSFDIDEELKDQDTAPSPPPKPLQPFRILSLDGGGLVGPIPQLIALKQHLVTLGETGAPSRHFDLIVGTSSAALPALLLGQLGLSIDETIALCAQVSWKAFGLDGPTSSDSKQGTQAKPRKVGRWSRFFSRGSRTSTLTRSPPDRRTALESILKQLIPSSSAPLPLSRTACRAAVLAFTRSRDSSSPRAREEWLTVDSNMTLSGIVQASMAFPSPSSPFVSSPTSLNPSASALSLSRSLLASPDQPIDLVSLSIGYSLVSIPTIADSKKRISKTRLEGLRQIKQTGAGNAAAAEALSNKLKRQGDAVRLQRVEAGCDASELARKDEGELIKVWKGHIEGRKTPTTSPLSPRQNSSTLFLSPPNSPSSFQSQPPPVSPSSSSTTTTSASSPRKQRTSPLKFFSSHSTARRSASSSEISTIGGTTTTTDFFPTSPTSRHLEFDEFDPAEEDSEVLNDRRGGGRTGTGEKGLKSSFSLGSLRGRFREEGGGRTMYGLGQGSVKDLRM